MKLLGKLREFVKDHVPWLDGLFDDDGDPKRMLEIAQAEQTAAGIKAGMLRLTDSGKIAQGSLLEHISKQVFRDSIRRELNLAKIVAQVKDELAKDLLDAPTAKIDEDWFEKYRASAGSVSDDRMQQLWAKLLAGEIREPGRYSLRAIAALSDMSPRDAKDIETVAPLAVDDFLVRDKDLLEKLGINLDLLLHLVSTGILLGVETGRLEVIIQRVGPSFERVLLNHNKGLLIRHANPEAKIRCPGYNLTRLGQEILSLGSFVGSVDVLTVLRSHMMIDNADQVRTFIVDCDVHGTEIRWKNPVPVPANQPA